MKDNQRLRSLFEDDQSERQKENIDWDVLSSQDAGRRKIVKDMLSKGLVRTATDYYHAAMVFQHDPHIEGITQAQSLAHTAIQMGDDRALWLYAAATDRILMRENKKQKFGTQYLQTVIVTRKDTVARKWVLYPYEKNTTDAMRAQ